MTNDCIRPPWRRAEPIRRALRAAAAAIGILVVALGVAMPARAHQASDAYLQLDIGRDGLALRWDVALRDLDLLLPALDADGDRQITAGEVRRAQAAIDATLRPHLGLDGCDWRTTGHALERRADGVYAVLRLDGAGCRFDPRAPWRYTLMADVDPTHRAIARIAHADGRREVRLLDPEAPDTLPAADEGGPVVASSFVLTGIEHILGGTDHVLFLLTLLLPAVLRRDADGRWQPVPRVRDALLPVAGIVTLFTLAHSTTLALATLRLVQLPAAFVEPAIAVTIALAALDNLRPIFGRRRAGVTFAFGLIHGFGFAGALGGIDLPPLAFAWALLQFNVGLELGQLGVLALAAPLLIALRARPLYPAWVLRGGSWAAMAMAAVWLGERLGVAQLL